MLVLRKQNRLNVSPDCPDVYVDFDEFRLDSRIPDWMIRNVTDVLKFQKPTAIQMQSIIMNTCINTIESSNIKFSMDYLPSKFLQMVSMERPKNKK